MRGLLSNLTARGRAFCAAGVTVVASAWVLGVEEISSIGALLLVLPLLSSVTARTQRDNLSLQRTLTPASVPAGGRATVRLRIGNEGNRSRLLLLEESTSYALGARPRFVIDRMGRGHSREVAYQAGSDARGTYQLGPLKVRWSDSFGLVQVNKTFSSTATLLVTPRTFELSPIGLGGVWSGNGEQRPRDFSGGSAEDVTVRDYRRGDDLRRVHWRSTAHRSEIMVRREEQPWQSRATVYVDDRASAHLSGSFEMALEAAASIALHLMSRGYHVRVLGTGLPRWEGDPSQANRLLDHLAPVGTTAASRLPLRGLTGPDENTLLVAVLGTLGQPDAVVLNQWRSSCPEVLGILLDPASLQLAQVARWRVSAHSPGQTLDATWRALTGPQIVAGHTR